MEEFRETVDLGVRKVQQFSVSITSAGDIDQEVQFYVFPTGPDPGVKFGIPAGKPVTKTVSLRQKEALLKIWQLDNNKIFVLLTLNPTPKQWASGHMVWIHTSTGQLETTMKVIQSFRF